MKFHILFSEHGLSLLTPVVQTHRMMITNEDMGDDATNIPGSSTSAASKKRGPSIGIEEIEGQPRPKLVMQTNRKGQPVTPIENVSEFGTRLGYIARRDIPICYDDWRHINKAIKDKVIKTLGRQFVFEYEKTIDTDYTRQKLNEAWRNYKHKLYETFVEDEDPSLVKEVAPRNIPLEDWHKFVDYCNTDKFKAMSERNKMNHEATDHAFISWQNFNCCSSEQASFGESQEVLNSIKNHISEHPELQYDLSEDAIATVVGPDKRGRYRGLGTGVCKTVLRKGDSLMKKNDGLMEANSLLERRMETMEANMDAKMSRHMEEVRGMFMSQRGAFNDNVPSPHSRASHHSTAPKAEDWSFTEGTTTDISVGRASQETHDSAPTLLNFMPRVRYEKRVGGGMQMIPSISREASLVGPSKHAPWATLKWLENAYYIGKDCELRGGWPLELVARGVVQDIDPNTEYGERTLEEGNFKVYVQVVRRPDAILPFPHNAWQRTLGQVVQGAVIWPKEFLVFASRSSSS
ncbi:hypothetical protein IFM89_024507 [Coptis chinensis]|uniref:Transposase Tnp1/En/Spm-like domain-containing protein n=1 Tax=Coptis chinensis TaxID=261450 RepID=A0A835H555_9MAGN|nr:hypothetical protein IFM89_024507 [Coptis chinensis]